MHPTKDVATSILALSKLQSASMYWSDQNQEEGKEQLGNGSGRVGEKVAAGIDLLTTALGRTSVETDSDKNNSGDNHQIIDSNTQARDGSNKNALADERDLLSNLAHYAVFANAAYGWKFGLLSGRLHWGDLATVTRKTGVERENIIASSWKAGTHLPVSFRLSLCCCTFSCLHLFYEIIYQRHYVLLWKVQFDYLVRNGIDVKARSMQSI